MKLAKSLIYPKNIKRVILALLLVVNVTFITMGAVYDVALKNVTLIQTSEFEGTNFEKNYRTRKLTVGEFLEENEILVKDNDIVNMNNEDELSNNDVLIIREGRLVELSADGKIEIVTVTKPTVGGALSELGVVLSEQDVVTPAVGDAVTDNMSIVVDRYVTEYTVETEAIKFDTKRVNKSSIAKGKTKVIETGKNGKKEVKYSVLKKNGEVISKEVVSETVIEEPVTRVVYVGTKKAAANVSTAKSTQASSSGSNTIHGYSYSKKLTVTATAYDGSPEENGGYTKTAYGLTPRYGVVAVDPKVIPLGTKLYIESPDGGKSWSYGYCIAGDTGGAIKGNKVDLCFNTKGECTRFGRKSAVVYILN